MKISEREKAKLLIETAPTVESVDSIINEYFKFETFKEKIAFLKGMFDCGEIIDQQPNDSDEMIYYLLLQGIISGN